MGTATQKNHHTEAETALHHHLSRWLATQAGADPLSALRQAAQENFSRLGLPHRRVEAWRYTDLRSRLLQVPDLPPQDTPPPDVSEEDLANALGEPLWQLPAARLVFVNGRFVPALSATDTLPEGVAFQSFSAALANPPAWFQATVGQTVTVPEDAILALNTAFMRDGATLHLSAGVRPEAPVHVIHVTAGEAAFHLTTRHVIRLEAGAALTLLESHVSLSDAPMLVNHGADVFLGEGAALTHVSLQDSAPTLTHFDSLLLALSEKARYEARRLTLGATLSRRQMFLRFAGQAAEAQLGEVAMLTGHQHGDTALFLDHAVPGCTSRTHYKAVVGDRATGIFQGRLKVFPGAQQTDGTQMARGLLLGEGSAFIAKPELEIYADDVTCGHGATSGQLDADALFYLRARGIPEAEARALLIRAFVGEVLDQITEDSVREAYLARAMARLTAM